jgi:hypothetical protein
MPLLWVMPSDVVGLTVLHGRFGRPAHPSDSEVESKEPEPVFPSKAFSVYDISADSLLRRMTTLVAKRTAQPLDAIVPLLTDESEPPSPLNVGAILLFPQILLFQLFPFPKPVPIVAL